MFSNVGSNEYEIRKKSLAYAKTYFEHGGSCDSFFSFQIIYLSMMFSANNEEELKKKYNLSPAEYNELLMNNFYKRIGLQRTEELDESLIGFSKIKVSSLVELFMRIKNETQFFNIN